MGRDVRVSMVAVAQGNLTVTISETPEVSQPLPFARARHDQSGAAHAASASRRTARKCSWSGKACPCNRSSTASTRMGIGPRDLITILQAIKAAGAIQADIEVM